MKIAILGAGFCGLATAWYLIQKGISELVIIDPLGIGKGASGVAAGLLHAYAGSQAKKNIRADEGMSATLELLKAAETAIGSSVIVSKGLVRLAVSEKQKIDFANVALLYPDVHWMTSDECSQKLGYVQPYPGIFIDSAVVVDCEKYLQGLWKDCSSKGVTFEKRKILGLRELEKFDHVIVTMGAQSKNLPELSEIKVTPIKGQVLEIDWPQELPTPLFPIASQAYLIMQDEKKKCISGASYERYFFNEEPDMKSALEDILPKLNAYMPQIDASFVKGCRAGVRASAPRHQPLLKKIDDKTWLLTGMGSKGLLYHALYAEELVSRLFTE